MKRRDKTSGKNLDKNRQPQAAEGDQEEEQKNSQCDAGLLKMAGRAVRGTFQYGIGVEKIDEADKSEKIEQENKDNFFEVGILH